MNNDTSYTTSVRSLINKTIMNTPQSIFEPLTDDNVVQVVDERVSLRLSRVLKIGSLQIIKKRAQKSNKRFIFVLSKDCLYFSLAQPIIVDRNYEFRSKARINVAWLQARFYTINEAVFCSESYFIEIARRNKSVTLMCDKISEYNAWVTNLSSITIQTNFFNKFSINHLLYKGPNSSVYKITNKFSSKKFACKKLKKADVLTTNRFESLIREIRALRILRNNCAVPRLEEIHETENSVYVVMELIEGGVAISPKSIKSMLSINHLARHLLDALASLEKHKVLHGNLIESNVMVVHPSRPIKSNQIKLVGFGNATILTQENTSFDTLSVSTYSLMNELNRPYRTLKPKPLNDIHLLVRLLFKTLINFYEMIYSTENIEKPSSTTDIDFNHVAFKSAPLGCNLISTEPPAING